MFPTAISAPSSPRPPKQKLVACLCGVLCPSVCPCVQSSVPCLSARESNFSSRSARDMSEAPESRKSLLRIAVRTAGKESKVPQASSFDFFSSEFLSFRFSESVVVFPRSLHPHSSSSLLPRFLSRLQIASSNSEAASVFPRAVAGEFEILFSESGISK